MTCASCAMRIEKGLKRVPGVIDANVNLATEKAAVIYNPTQTNLEQMVQKVEAVGYKATPEVASLRQTAQETEIGLITQTPGESFVSIPQEDELSRRRQAEIIRKRNLLILGIVLTLPVVILSMFFLIAFPVRIISYSYLPPLSGQSWVGSFTGALSSRCAMAVRIWIRSSRSVRQRPTS